MEAKENVTENEMTCVGPYYEMTRLQPKIYNQSSLSGYYIVGVQLENEYTSAQLEIVKHQEQI